MTTQHGKGDPYNLQRFLEAQESTYEQARSELSAGQKRSHWMWFIFPHIRGLGSSSMAQRFAIADLKEARAYLDHPVLGSRLRECTDLVNAVPQRTASEIFGYPDDLKFHSSVTLFGEISVGISLENNVFSQVIAKYFGGKLDAATLDRLRL
jgi:uncharacterized protein (DUF1810 family)